MSKFLLFVSTLVLTVSFCARAGEVVVGTNAEFPPFELTNEKNEIIGYDIDVIKAVGKAAGFDVRMQNQSFDTLVESLESGKIDAAVSGMTITEARKAKIDFSEPYYNAAQVIVVKKGTKGLTSMETLKDKVVGVQLGTTGATMGEETMGQNNSNLKQFRKYNEVFNDLKLGRIDAIVVDLPVAHAYLKRIPDLEISSEPMSQEEYGIAVKKGNAELLGKINAGLATIRENGEYDAITAKWFQD